MKTIVIVLVVVVIAAIIMMGRVIPKSAAQSSPQDKDRPDDFPPTPKWKPEIPVDLDRIVKTFRYYSNNKETFAVFKNGTCIIVDAESTQPEQDALAILDELFNRHPDFNPRQMDDGNWMVFHSNAAYSICFADEVEANWETIDKNHLDAIPKNEVLLNAKGEPNVFDKLGKIGLFGRARWFMDCQDPVVVKIERPDSQ